MQTSDHFNEMLAERGLQRKWIDCAIESPDQVEDRDDGTRHFIKQINEYENRWLRVVANVRKSPPVLITAFFDRRLRKR